jgi:Domain of unknown function (DUF4384)
MLTAGLLLFLTPLLQQGVGARGGESAGVDVPVRVWLDDENGFEPGGRARVFVRASEDAYLLVLHADPDGRVRVLFPLDPVDDNFVRGGEDLEIRGRGDRDALAINSSDGTGVVYAAVSPDPFRFTPFVQGDHWDYRVMADAGIARHPEAGLSDIVRRMSSDGGFEYDLVTYEVGQQVADSREQRYDDEYEDEYDDQYDEYDDSRYDEEYESDLESDRWSYGWSSPYFGTRWYDPFYGPYGSFYGSSYRSSFGIGLGFGSARLRFGSYRGHHGPFFHDPFFCDSYYYDPFACDPYYYDAFRFRYGYHHGYRYYPFSYRYFPYGYAYGYSPYGYGYGRPFGYRRPGSYTYLNRPYDRYTFKPRTPVTGGVGYRDRVRTTDRVRSSAERSGTRRATVVTSRPRTEVSGIRGRRTPDVRSSESLRDRGVRSGGRGVNNRGVIRATDRRRVESEDRGTVRSDEGSGRGVIRAPAARPEPRGVERVGRPGIHREIERPRREDRPVRVETPSRTSESIRVIRPGRPDALSRFRTPSRLDRSDRVVRPASTEQRWSEPRRMEPRRIEMRGTQLAPRRATSPSIERRSSGGRASWARPTPTRSRGSMRPSMGGIRRP